MARVRMSRAGTLKDLGVGILIIALRRWLDGVDDVINWSVAGLPPPKVVLPTPIMIIIAVVMVIVVPIIAAIVMTPIIAPVVWAAIWLVRARSPANVFLDLLVGLISICPLLRHREKVLNRFGPLAEKFGPESIMVAETSDKRGDSLIAINVRDGYPRLSEAADVVMEQFIWIVSDFLQIILVAGLLKSGHIIVNKSPPKLNPGVDGAFPQAEKPLVCRLVDDHRQIIGHHIFITMCCLDSDFVERYPLFGIGLLVVGIKIMELEVSWPDDSTELISKWSEARDMTSIWCIATAVCAVCSIVFLPALHLRCMTHFSIVLNAIPQIQISTEMFMEVTSRLLHFLVSAALSTTATTAVCNTLSSMTCATSALLITFAPLIGVMLASLVGIAPFALISRTVHLIVHVVALVKIRTSSLPGASFMMTSGGGRRWSRCTPLVDLDCGRLQISLNSIKCQGF
jgi:hypothetical protein